MVRVEAKAKVWVGSMVRAMAKVWVELLVQVVAKVQEMV